MNNGLNYALLSNPKLYKIRSYRYVPWTKSIWKMNLILKIGKISHKSLSTNDLV